MSLPRPLEDVLDSPRKEPRRRVRPFRLVWPVVLPGSVSPVVEFHYEPLPPKLSGPYIEDVPK